MRVAPAVRIALEDQADHGGVRVIDHTLDVTLDRDVPIAEERAAGHVPACVPLDGGFVGALLRQPALHVRRK
jgi:hypothetical protein